MPLNNSEKYTIRNLFEENFQFSIPSYQRAFSWEVDGSVRKHVRQFILDLEEQHPQKDYYLGHFLFEKDQHQPNYLFVIDGQQRLTTVVIFFSCLIRELKVRTTSNEATAIMELNPQRLAETYLRRGGKRRLRTVDSDVGFFDDRILDQTSIEKGDTRSRKRIAQADVFFTQKFKDTGTPTLLRWAQLVEGAVITTFPVHDKVQATQIFSFQNDRGKDLTELEKLKAFLVYQVYLNSGENEEIEAIKHVEERFSEIYVNTEEIYLLGEDQILNHHCTAYLKQRWLGALETVKLEIKEVNDRADRVAWVKKFSSALRESFSHVKALQILCCDHECIADPLILDGHDAWPILMKLYKYFDDKLLTDHFARLFRAMELTLFKMHFLHGRCKNDLHDYAREFDGDAPGAVEELQRRLEDASKHSFRGGQDCDQALRYALLNWKNHYQDPFGYLLWKYENSLRGRGDQHLMPSDYMNSHTPRTHEKTIDHISPQDSKIPYADEFIRDCLNDLGNLVYMTRSMNATKRNTPPLDMDDSFWDSTCASHREIKAIISASGGWGKYEIEARKKKIVTFALARWEAQPTESIPET